MRPFTFLKTAAPRREILFVVFVVFVVFVFQPFCWAR
jgi:hypothetical protein